MISILKRNHSYIPKLCKRQNRYSLSLISEGMSQASMEMSSVSNAVQNANVLGIMRENHNMWERRAPLTPQQIKALLDNPNAKDMKVLVQPCTRRVYKNREYEEVGAIITDDLSEVYLFIC